MVGSHSKRLPFYLKSFKHVDNIIFYRRLTGYDSCNLTRLCPIRTNNITHILQDYSPVVVHDLLSFIAENDRSSVVSKD